MMSLTNLRWRDDHENGISILNSGVGAQRREVGSTLKVAKGAHVAYVRTPTTVKRLGKYYNQQRAKAAVVRALTGSDLTTSKRRPS